MELKIQTSRIKLADLKYFDKEQNGVELSDSLSKGILIDPLGDDNYYNLFCFSEYYPVFKRERGSNVSLSGEEYGTRMSLVSNELASGPCWVLSKVSFRDEVGKDEVSISDIEEYVINSSYFFKDRVAIIEDRFKGRKGRKWHKKVLSDEQNRRAMEEFFAARECGVQKTKKD